MTRRGVRSDGTPRPPRVTALQGKEKRLATELQRVWTAIANTHGSPDAIPQHAVSSSSTSAVRIQPGSQSVIPLQGENDHSHQITLSYREPDGSGRIPASNATSLPIYTCVVDALAIGASLEEFSVNVVNSTYQFILRTHTLHGHPTDMARIALMSPHLRGRGISTPTVLIANLADALQATGGGDGHSSVRTTTKRICSGSPLLTAGEFCSST
jgi:hypothetical protein